MQPLGHRNDPAPSRARYRMQRLMLTPLFRRLLRISVPLVGALAIGGVVFGDADRRDIMFGYVADVRRQIETRPEFMVNMMAIDGTSEEVAEDIREVVSLDFPMSSFEIDLPSVLSTIRELSAVRDATVRVRPGGILQIQVTERDPVVVWRTRSGLELLDVEGVSIREVGFREDYANLPLIAGEGPDKSVAQALEIIRAVGPLNERLRGIIRIGERRWDVSLDNDQVIKLPEDQPVQALERVIALHQAQDMLGRDIAVIDMRIGERPTLRLSKAASDEWWQVKETILGKVAE